MSQQSAIYVDHMGNDKSVVNAARLSFGNKIRETTSEQDQSLIRFLANGVSSKDRETIIELIQRGIVPTSGLQGSRIEAEELYNNIKHQAVHWTPFAHTAISIKMKAPIPIRTQCFKHKQGMVENEESRRYISSVPEIFIPEFRSKPEGSIKQGSGDLHPNIHEWKMSYSLSCQLALTTYLNMLKDGIAPEQARMVLPQGAMVNWLWTGNLLSFSNFYNKRSDSHAQGEIQDLAEMVKSVVQPLFPVSWNALTR